MEHVWAALVRLEERQGTLQTDLACTNLVNKHLKKKAERNRAKKRVMREELVALKAECAKIKQQNEKLSGQLLSAVRERDVAVRERDAVLHERDAIVRERDTVLQSEAQKRQRLRGPYRVLHQSLEGANGSVAQALEQLKQACMV